MIETTDEPIRISRQDGVLTLCLNRPGKKNALNHAMYQTLAEALEAADSDPDIRAILFTGAGAAYCSGNDLQDFLDSPPLDQSAPVFRFILALANAGKPLLAAVNGLAVGIGVTMLLHCDVVYADEQASFSMPFVKLGVCVEAGASLLLPMLCGHRRAAELLLGEAPCGVLVARDLGLVNRVLASTELQAAALAEARRIASLPPEATQANKRLLRAPFKADLLETIAREADCFSRLVRQPEAQQIMRGILANSPQRSRQ